ncbi:hypothetical protein AWRI3578_g3512 [Hanseniaspora opuntiae]|uniref:Uncharacterized protein n=1 Tax=Hanseniaspora opuntiae TaxID=211096 RepID=A0A1E5R6W6_9ASCO|nr:hypothetical protein AWRI3578_g3512 [Hanseniaspora opuntiae]
MNKIHTIPISNTTKSLDDFNHNHININNKRELVSPNIEFFYQNFNVSEPDFQSSFVLKPILKKTPSLIYYVQGSSGQFNFKDAVIFGTQINIINAIKQRQENTSYNDDIVADLALPLPCNIHETISIKINTAIKEQYIQKKCLEDNGGYYYDDVKSNPDVEEYAIINAQVLDCTDYKTQHKKQKKIIKKVRFV